MKRISKIPCLCGTEVMLAHHAWHLPVSTQLTGLQVPSLAKGRAVVSLLRLRK